MLASGPDTARNLGIAAGLFLLAGVFRLLDSMLPPLPSALCFLLTSFLHIGLTFAWGISFFSRTLHSGVRRRLLLGCGMTVLWLVFLSAGTRLHSAPVHDRHVYWVEDLTPLHRMQERPEEIRAHLAEENELIRAEAEVMRQRAEIEEISRLYDRISGILRPCIHRMDELLAKGGREQLQRVCMQADILLMEAGRLEAYTLDNRLRLIDRVREKIPRCKFALLCDENSDRELARQVKIARQNHLIDAFFYASVTPGYLTAAVEAL